MGPRIREDNGGEGAHEGRPYGDAGVRRRSVIGGEIPRGTRNDTGHMGGLHVGGGGHAHEG